MKSTPETLAEAFWEMDSEHQAHFFQHLAKIAGNQEALEAYQSFFAAAYKYMGPQD